MAMLLYYATNTKEEIVCEFSFINEKNIFSFTCEKFLFNIKIEDSLELKDFYSFLNKKQGKIILSCSLKKGKIYRGKRKFIWKNENINVSQGGIRIEFNKEIQELLKKIIEEIIF